jgi:hypothetical protein
LAGASAATAATIGAGVTAGTYVAASAMGGVEIGKATYEAATSEEHTWSGTGRHLTDEERSASAGAAFVGALSLGLMARSARGQRASAANPETGDTAMTRNLIRSRAETGKPGEATLAQSRSGGKLSEVAESRPIPNTEAAVHAEPQVMPPRGGSIVVDQTPCTNCASRALLRGTEVSVPESTNPGQSRLSPKSVARKAAAGKLDPANVGTRTVIPGQQLAPLDVGELVRSNASENEWVNPKYYDPKTGKPRPEMIDPRTGRFKLAK